MLNIKLIAVGKVKEKYWQEAGAEFLKRLQPYARLEIVEIAPSPFSDSNKEKVKKEETEKIVKILSKYNPEDVFLLDENGQEFTSSGFAQELGRCEGREVIFAIAGSLGFDKKIYESYNKRLSLSRLTFLHEMARVILLEQIYRAIMINKEKEYHH